jgi:hypothetical protein
MKITVMHEGELSELAHRHSIFARLHDAKITKLKKRCWSRDAGASVSHDIQIVLIGKSGYGKSTTLNTIFGQPILSTSDIKACTKNIQSFEFKIRDGHFLSFADLPGLGESEYKDKKYLVLYSKIIQKADAIIYLLRADMRDFSIDEIAFKQLFKTAVLRRKVIFVLNGCDKIEPINRRLPFNPTFEQLKNIEKKIESVHKFFNANNKIVPYSAITEWNMSELIEEIMRIISLQTGIKLLEL